MTRAEALSTLESGSPHERLQAARFLAAEVTPEDLPALLRARQAETVSYVKRSLELAISRSMRLVSAAEKDSPEDEAAIPDDVRRRFQIRAVREVATLLLHEIAAPIGLAKSAASREVPNFAGSHTRRHLEHLQRLYDGIVQLKVATAVAKPEPFDLADFLQEVVAVEMGGSEVAVSLHGPRPMNITTDPHLLGLAVSNGVRNAVESVLEVVPRESHPIVITWGETDVDYWIAVIDRGIGFVGPTEAAFEIGKSTKKRHSGFGLAVARQSMETLGGTVSLQPGAEGGARYELRWER